MNIINIILAFLAELAGISYTPKFQIPRPHAAGSLVQYPQDYCLTSGDYQHFDYVVIGAGPAGATVARRLAEIPENQVLLLEAGGDPIPFSDIPGGCAECKPLQPSMIWDLKTNPSNRQCTGFKGNSCPYNNGKFLGGSSVVNLMLYVRGNHRDYDEWESSGCPGWGWRDMFPYFLKLENYKDPRHQATPDFGYHRVGGPLTTSPPQEDPQSQYFRTIFKRGLLNQNIMENNDHNGRSQVGFGDVTGLLEENGYRDNVAKAYLLNIPDNLKVCKHSLVTRLHISPAKVVNAVEFIYNGTGKAEKRLASARKDHIVSAGPIYSPQILERSGIGRREVLEKAGVPLVHELRGVGENLHEQFVNFGCAFTLDLLTETAKNPLSLGLMNFLMFLNMTDYSNPVPDLEFEFNTGLPKSKLKAFKPEIAAQYEALNRTIFFAGSAVLRQTTPGYVHITGTNPQKPPSFNPNQFTSPQESHLITEGCRLMRRVMKDPVNARFKAEPFVLNECKHHPFNSVGEIMCGARLVPETSYHIAGTTKMGPASDKSSVVDTRLRVHGFYKLRIVDLGVMPLIPRGNTEVPTIAVAERAADIIKRDHDEMYDSINEIFY